MRQNYYWFWFWRALAIEVLSRTSSSSSFATYLLLDEWAEVCFLILPDRSLALALALLALALALPLPQNPPRPSGENWHWGELSFGRRRRYEFSRTLIVVVTRLGTRGSTDQSKLLVFLKVKSLPLFLFARPPREESALVCHDHARHARMFLETTIEIGLTRI